MKTRIAFVSQPGAWSGPPQPQGSIEIWTHEVARRLIPASGVRVYRPTASLRTRFSLHDGVEYVAVSALFDRLFGAFFRLVLRRRPSSFSVLHCLGYALRVAFGIAAFRPDVVHIQNQFPFVRVIRWINRRVPMVLHMHNGWLTELDRAVVGPSLTRVDRVMVPSDHLAEEFRRFWPERAQDCVRIPNGVEAGWLNGPRLDVRDDDEVLFVGRLSPEKGLHDLLAAFELVADRRPATRLTIIGPRAVAPLAHVVALSDDASIRDLARFYSGDHYPDLLRSSVPAHLRDRVRFVSTMPHDQLLDVYRRATVVVNPSLSESFGMSVVEAMATGTPVVATAVGGMREILADGVGGILVQPGDPGRLAEAILAVLDDPALREELGTTGRARVAARYTWDLVTEDTQFVYAGLEDGARTKQLMGSRFDQIVNRAMVLAPEEMTGRTLVVAPHPDDETLGCGGTIAALTAAGQQVAVVFLTDGGLSGPGDRHSTVEERKAEARLACDLLGVKPAHISFVGLPDGGLANHASEAGVRLAQIIDSFDPVRVFVPHEHDGHPDHEAAYRIARKVTEGRSQPIELFEYAIWLWSHWPWTPAPTIFTRRRPELKRAARAWRQSWHAWRRGDARSLDHVVDIDSTAWRKRDALAVYRSQLPSLSTLGRGRFLRWFRTSQELFRVRSSV